MKKIAFLFPGQGAQAVGMGEDFYTEFEAVKEVFGVAEEITKLNLSKLCFSGPIEELTETVNCQPAVTMVNLAILAAIEKEGIKGVVTAGHSLGEYSALGASGTITKEETFELVKHRGALMHRESLKSKGAMAAIIGLTIDQVTNLVDEGRKTGIVAVANHNSELQIAITGEPAPVEKVSEKAVALGARAVPLNVSGAWHSELIRGAEGELNSCLQNASFKPPAIPIVLNVTGEPATDPETIQKTMMQQLCSPVRWYDTMCYLMSEKIEIFAEIGPGNVLSGLLKRTLPKDYPGEIYTINNLKRFEKFHKEMT